MSGIFCDNQKNIVEPPFHWQSIAPFPSRNCSFVHFQQLCELFIAQTCLILVSPDLPAECLHFVIEGVIAEEGNYRRILVYLRAVTSIFPVT